MVAQRRAAHPQSWLEEGGSVWGRENPWAMPSYLYFNLSFLGGHVLEETGSYHCISFRAEYLAYTSALKQPWEDFSVENLSLTFAWRSLLEK